MENPKAFLKSDYYSLTMGFILDALLSGSKIECEGNQYSIHDISTASDENPIYKFCVHETEKGLKFFEDISIGKFVEIFQNKDIELIEE